MNTITPISKKLDVSIVYAIVGITKIMISTFLLFFVLFLEQQQGGVL